MSHKTEIPATVAASTQCVDGNYSEIPAESTPNVRVCSRLSLVNHGRFLGRVVAYLYFATEIFFMTQEVLHYARTS